MGERRCWTIIVSGEACCFPGCHNTDRVWASGGIGLRSTHFPVFGREDLDVNSAVHAIVNWAASGVPGRCKFAK
jgi:hypothetical protein